ncbi:MAG: prolipoprotein diacylglyceryl transferase [Chloroflexaceae bacterium]|nr:prolipoprotein diacylglyceryl transferase [Chloroflexaceae bacterium]
MTIALVPPDDPFLLKTTLPVIVLLLLAGGFIGAAVGSSWVSHRAGPSGAPRGHSWVAALVGGGGGLAVVLLGSWLVAPDDPLLLAVALPLTVRWYGVLIMSGVTLGAWLAACRARGRGYASEHVWNQVMVGLVLGIIGARVYYVIFEWPRFEGNIWAMLNITRGGLAIHGGIIGMVLAAALYARRQNLPFWEWVDIFVPGLLVAQAIGRWGNFFNQEAYGVPTNLGFGVRIDPAYRLPQYRPPDYPLDTLFHPTFLYESLWNLVGAGVLLVVDRRFGAQAPPPTRWLRPGDLFFLYAIFYSFGRFWIEGLRTDSLYLGPLRVAQVISLGLIGAGFAALVINHQQQRHHHQPS